MYTHDHPHLFASHAPLPTRQHQIAVKKCEELLCGDESLVSRSFMLREYFQHDNVV